MQLMKIMDLFSRYKIVRRINCRDFIIFLLGNLTQIVWIKLYDKLLRKDKEDTHSNRYLHYISVFSLKYQKQLNKYKEYKYEAKTIVPNIVVVSDSISRANFLHPTPSTVHFYHLIIIMQTRTIIHTIYVVYGLHDSI